jgi:hypothetical protein
MEANYTIKALPINNKSWEEADNLEVSLILCLPNEKRVFKGIATLSGIMK